MKKGNQKDRNNGLDYKSRRVHGEAPFIERLEQRLQLTTAPQLTQIHLDQARIDFPSITGTGTVAIIDAGGLDTNNPYLAGKVLSDSKSFDPNDPSITPNYNDGNPVPQHATGSAGQVAATAWSDGTYNYQGIAPSANILMLKAHGDPDSNGVSEIKQALDYVISKITADNIVAVNITDFEGPYASGNPTYLPELQTLAADNVFVTTPAGNSPTNIAYSSQIDPYLHRIGGTDATSNPPTLWTSSARGTAVSLVAPAYHMSVLWASNTDPNLHYYASSGTSWAGPVVATTADLMHQLNPGLTITQIFNTLVSTATPVSDSTGTYDLINVDAALKAVAPEAPYGGTAAPIPGTIQAENFDTGGQNVAYYDSDAANQGGAYRTSEAVDIQSTTDTGGGYNVGWVTAGEWLKYTVNVSATGNYDFTARVANTAAGGVFHLEVDGTTIATLSVPQTAGFQSFVNVTAPSLSLTAGTHVLRVVFDTASSNGFVGNFNWYQFTASAGSTGVFTGTDIGAPTPAGTTTENSSTDYTVTGGGWAGISSGNTSDAFQFASQATSADSSNQIEIVADLKNWNTTAASGTTAYSQAGIMIRDSLAAGAGYYGLIALPAVGSTAGFLYVQYRADNNAAATVIGVGALNAGTDLYLKIDRNGNQYNSYYSTDGVHYTAAEPSRTLALGNLPSGPVESTLQVGLASSGHNGNAAAAHFTNVSLTTTNGGQSGLTFSHDNVGSGLPAGSESNSGSTYTVSGAGQGFDKPSSGSDQFHFEDLQITGDFTFTTQISVAALSNFTPYGGAGLIVRDSNASGGREYAAELGSNGFAYGIKRTTAGSAVSYNGNSVSGTVILRIKRTGSTIECDYSTDGGTTYTTLATVTDSSLPSTLYVGLFVATGSASQVGTATFSNVLLTQ